MPNDDFTPRLGLPYLLPNQALKHVTLNESLRWLDALIMASVESVGAGSPPAAPAAGSAYITGESPDGAWQGHAGELAAWLDDAWYFKAPQAGWRVWNREAAALLVFDGQGWQPVAGAPGTGAILDRVQRFGLGTVADDATPFQARLGTALFTAPEQATEGSGDLRLVLNKAASADTASIVFQDAWTGHAELALSAGNRFGVRVSADGTDWRDGLMLDPQAETLETHLDLVPGSDNVLSLGHPDRVFRSLYLGTAPQVQSDARLKTEISGLDTASQLIAALRPVRFRRGREPGVHFGFLAQDVKAALETCGEADAVLWRRANPDDEASTQMLRPTELIAVLVSALQVLTTRVEQLEADRHAVSED